MKEIVLISHGDMAQGVKMSLEMIVGQTENVHVVSLRPEGDNIQFENDLRAKIETLSGNKLIIADLLGGTPCNVALKLYSKAEDVEIMAGLNLPLTLEAYTNGVNASELAKLGQNSIVDVKETMNQTASKSKVQTNSDLSIYQDYANKANIVNTRIDERLIHGQVAGFWTTNLNAQRIIVANDEAASDDLQRSSLRMAANSTIRLSILPVEEAAKNIQAGKYGNQRIFLLFKNPTDVKRYLDAGGNIETVTIGNMSFKEGSREVIKNINVLPNEEIIFNDIAGKGVNLVAQLVPNDPQNEFTKLLNK